MRFFRRRGVALKLALLGLIPLLVLLGAAFRVASLGSAEVNELRSFDHSVDIAVAAGELRSRLQAEQFGSVARLRAGGRIGVSGIQDERGPASRALEQFNTLVNENGDRATPRVRALARRARGDDLTQLRSEIDSLTITAGDAARAFENRTAVLDDLIGRLDEEIPSPELINETLAYSALSAVIAPAWEERDGISTALVAGGAGAQRGDDLRRLAAEQEAFSREFLRKAQGASRAAWVALESGPATARVEEIRRASLSETEGSVVPVSSWLSASGERLNDIVFAQSTQGGQLQTRVTEEIAGARRKIITQLGFLSVALLVLLVGGALLAGSITRPLSRVAREARRVAGGEPPNALPPGGPDEIGDVTDAFSSLNQTIDVLQGDTERVLASVQAGDLSARAKAEGLTGFWAVIPAGVNRILDEFGALGGRLEVEAGRQRLLAEASAEALTVDSVPAFHGTLTALVQRGLASCRVGLIDCSTVTPRLLSSVGKEWPSLPIEVRDWPDRVPRVGAVPIEPLIGSAYAAVARVAMPNETSALLYVERADEAFSPEELSFLSTAASVLAQAEGRAWAEDRLRRQSIHDELTDLPNRAFFEGSVRRAGEADLDGDTRHAIIIADIDRFQRVNESLGHGAADALLGEIAQRLQSVLPANCLLARFGADEFIVHLDDHDGSYQPEKLVEKLQHCFETHFEGHGNSIHLGVSIGLAEGSGRDAATGSLASNADTALRLAKAKPGSAVEHFTPGQHAVVARRSWLETALWNVINNAEMAVHFQPIVDLESGRTVALEALARWPGDDEVSPAEFIPLAEEMGLIGKLDAVVRGNAIRWAAELPEPDAPDISLNLSPRQLEDPDLARSLKAAIADSGIDPGRIILEITESAIVGEDAGTLSALESLRELGVKLVIDDFGTGYSSFAYLGRLPIDGLKIDRVFVAGTDMANHEIVLGSIIHLCNELGLTATAEGVETLEQLDMLREMGCDRAQGFYLARPVPPEELDFAVAAFAQQSEDAA